jgi:LacI family transcriptional regulator
VVQISREIEGVELDFVGSDDEYGVQLAIDHLVSYGHRRIAMIGGNDGTSTGRARHRGYEAAMKRHGLPVDPTLIYKDFGTRQTGLAGVQRVLDLPEPPTAAFCFNDLTAFGALLGLRHRGREAGVDFSIVGCDDVQEAAQWYPALTTVRNHHAEMGRRAAEMLMERIEHPDLPPRRFLITPELVVRASTVRI